MCIRKILSKLFSIICALTLVLTLIPFNTVQAQTDSYLPKNIKTDKVLVFDLSHDLQNHDAEAKEAYMAITSIQGIVNRTSTTKIYLTHTPQEHTWTPYAADQSWLDNGLIPADKEYPSLNYGKKYPVLSYLLEHYQDQLKGIIQVPELSGTIIDGAIMAGVTAAGIEDSILVSKNIENYILKEGYEFDVKANTRDFKDNIEAFEWAYENYFEQCNKTFAAQHTFTAFGGGMDDQFPIMYDYYISSQVFVFCLDGNKPEELATLQNFLVPKNYAPGTAVLGLPVDEGKGISCISDQGYYFAIMYIPNLTVTSSFEYDASSIVEPVEPTAIKPNNNTNYVAFFVTDGDSMGFPTNFMYEHITNSSNRGEVPIGWSFNPHLIDLFPTLLSYYSKNNYNSFYEYVSSMNNGGSPKNEEGAEVFKNRYVDYVKKANGMFRTINYFNDDEYINDLAQAINPYLLIKGYQGQTNGNQTEWGTINNKITYTTISGATQGNAQTDNIYQALSKISNEKEDNKPTFTIVCIGDGRHSGDPASHVSEAIEKLKADNPTQNFTFMRPSDLAATYKYYSGDDTVKVGQPKVVSFSNENVIDKIVVDKTEVELVEGTETSIKGYAMDANNQYIPQLDITYKSLDEDIATIDSNGKIKALKNGTAKIEVSCNDKKVEVTVTVIGKTPSSISVDKEIFSTAVGGQAIINAELYDQFGHSLPTPEFTWKSSNDDIVTVNNGLITGIGKGEAMITVSYGEISTQVKITVLESTASISKIVIEPSYMEMYENDIYRVVANAYDNQNHEVFGFTPQWSIDNPDIASIDSDGYITAHQNGTAHITATFGEDASENIDLLVKKDDRQKVTFDEISSGDILATAGDITFESGAFEGSDQQDGIQGNAIKLISGNYEKAFWFSQPTILKSIKVYNPTNQVITVSLVGSGSLSYQIAPHKALTLATNWQTNSDRYVIKTTNTDIVFGEFVYGEAEPIPTRLVIDQSDGQISISKDGEMELSATLYDQNNNVIKPENLEWSTDRDDIVSIDQNGKIKGVAVGSTFIYAKAHGLVASTLVYVTESNVQNIEINPSTFTYYVGDIIPLSATAYDINGEILHFPVTFTSGNTDILQIIDNHYAQALASGVTYITANVSGKEMTIPAYVQEHPESDHIINFEEFNQDDSVTTVHEGRVKFEDYFWKVTTNVPGIKGNAIHLADENTGEKAYYFEPSSTVKSFKVHNPTSTDRSVIIKTLDNSLPKVEYIVPAGETLTIYTNYTGQATGYAFETYWQMLIGEIVYSDTLETGFTAEMIAQGITFINQPSINQEKIELPHIDGFDISISKSSHPDIINNDGIINPLGIDQDVQLTLKVQNQNNAEDLATTTPITVKVLGIPANKTALQQKLLEIDEMDLSIYKPSSVESLTKLYKLADEAIKNAAIRQNEIDEMISQINDALNQLEKKADKSILKDYINTIYQMDLSSYTPQTVNELKKSLESAIQLIEDEEVNQSDIDKMINQLNKKIQNLQQKADFSNLQQLLETMNKIELSSYTDSSVIHFKNAITDAQDILNNPNASQNEVDQITKNLRLAYEQLEQKKEEVKDNSETDSNNKPIVNTDQTTKDQSVVTGQSATKEPISTAVQTMDNVNPLLWIIVGSISLGLFIFITKCQRKSKNNNI